MTTTLSNLGPINTGTSVHDSATISGATANAGGTITYKIYSNNTCSNLVADVTPANNTVVNHVAPDSNSYQFNSAGTFYWQATYSGDANNSGPVSSVCTSETLVVNSTVVKGHIMHTGVTCSDFLANNPSDELTDATYGIKSSKVNNVAPGVMFYYISITAPSANFTINVTQSNDKGWKPIPAQGSNQVILYSAPSCAKSNKGSGSYNATTGTSTITVTGASANETFVVGVKYSLSDLAGQPVTAPGPVVTYSFATNFNGGSDYRLQSGHHQGVSEALEERGAA